MKILIIMGGFFPGKKFGGPPVSVDNFCTLVKDQASCYVVTHNHDMGDKTAYPNIQDGWNKRGSVNVLYLSDKEYCLPTFNRVIKEIQPNYIYLQSLFQNCIIPCLILAKKHNIKVVLAPRGELCSGAFKKKYKKLPYIAVLRLFGLVNNISYQSTSEEETAAIRKYLGAEPNRIHLLTNIPSIPSDLPPKEAKKSGVGRFVFISRILWKKNLFKAIEFFRTIKGDVVFDIYGPKEDERYWVDCEKAIQELPSNIKIEYKGILSHDEIHATFNKYDAFLFPTFSENYGHVIAESLVSGCIPILSDQTPWNDINEAGAGWAISLNNEAGFLSAIQTVVNMTDQDMARMHISISAYLNMKMKIEDLKRDYLQMFE